MRRADKRDFPPISFKTEAGTSGMYFSFPDVPVLHTRAVVPYRQSAAVRSRYLCGASAAARQASFSQAVFFRFPHSSTEKVYTVS